MAPLSGVPKGFTVWHFVTSCAAVKLAKPWLSNHFSESRDSSYVGSTICPECPGKSWRCMSCCLHLRAAKSSPKDQVEWLHPRPCLIPSWYWASKTIWDRYWPWGISSLPRTAASATFSEEMWAGKRIKKWVLEAQYMMMLRTSYLPH